LGVPFRDTDADIVAETGLEVSDIFLTHGEDTFRDLERAAVVEALAGHPGVLALGGGAVVDEEIRELLSLAPTVWLKASAPAATARVGMNTARPVLLGNVRQQLAALLVERDPFYSSVALATVVTDDLELDGVVDAVIAAVPALAGAERGSHG
jgi:shikimate kinase